MSIFACEIHFINNPARDYGCFWRHLWRTSRDLTRLSALREDKRNEAMFVATTLFYRVSRGDCVGDPQHGRRPVAAIGG
jgi:hypothetical protein